VPDWIVPRSGQHLRQQPDRYRAAR
jgi:hypothetical protein